MPSLTDPQKPSLVDTKAEKTENNEKAKINTFSEDDLLNWDEETFRIKQQKRVLEQYEEACNELEDLQEDLSMAEQRVQEIRNMVEHKTNEKKEASINCLSTKN